MSRNFTPVGGAEAIGWLRERHRDHIKRGWVERRPLDSDVIPSGDALLICIGEDSGALRECCLCARPFTAKSVQCVAHARFEGSTTELPLGVVCDTCVAAGPGGLRTRLATTAIVAQNADYDDQFVETRWRLSKGRIHMPRLEDLLAARNALPGTPDGANSSLPPDEAPTLYPAFFDWWTGARSIAAQRVVALLDVAAPLSATHLLSGPAGTDFASLTLLIHVRSGRSDPLHVARFRPPPHETADLESALTAAGTGTLCLDGVDFLTGEQQSYLLKRMQEDCRARVVAITYADLRKRTRLGFYNEDLYCRLNVVPFAIPPVSASVEDVVHYLQTRIAQVRGPGHPLPTFDDEAAHMVTAYAWPGNHDEVKRVATVLASLPGDTITAADLPLADPTLPPADGAFGRVVRLVSTNAAWGRRMR